MTKQVFKGFIDGKTFDNIAEFKEYLNEHPESTTISLSSYAVDAEEEQKTSKKEFDLYPPVCDPDKFIEDYKVECNYDDALDDVSECLFNHAREHAEAIKTLDPETLKQHQRNLMDLAKQMTAAVEKSDQAIDNINKRIAEDQERLETATVGNELVNLYEDHYLELLEQVDDLLASQEHKPVDPCKKTNIKTGEPVVEGREKTKQQSVLMDNAITDLFKILGLI